MAATQAHFVCEACGKPYPRKPEWAGRKVKCSCGHVMIAPAAPSPGDDEELYDLVPEWDAPQKVEPVAPAPTPVCAVSYAREETLGTSAVEQYFPDRVKDLYMPLALIGAGTLIEVGMAAFGRRSVSIASASAAVGGYMIANALIMLATVFVVAKVRGISFGPVPTAIVKLCGISIGPGAIGSLLSLALGWLGIAGLILGWLAGCILYFAMIGALFDLDQSDTWVVCFSVFAAKVLLVAVILRML